jgi:hypothetical protein
MKIKRRLIVFIAAVVFVVVSAGAQEPNAPSASPVPMQLRPVPGQVVTLTSQAGFHNEPSIAVNPINASQIVAAYQAPATVACSRDGGSSWKVAAGTAPTDYRVSGDVSVTYDKHGAAIEPKCGKGDDRPKNHENPNPIAPEQSQIFLLSS